jgi:hypothetical protein
VLSINKRKGITHGGAKTNMDVGSWQKMPSLGSRVLLVVNWGSLQEGTDFLARGL